MQSFFPSHRSFGRKETANERFEISEGKKCLPSLQSLLTVSALHHLSNDQCQSRSGVGRKIEAGRDRGRD